MIDKPWAKDVNGKELNTYLQLESVIVGVDGVYQNCKVGSIIKK